VARPAEAGRPPERWRKSSTEDGRTFSLIDYLILSHPRRQLWYFRGDKEAEFALVISDAGHRLGLGAEMLKRLVEVGKKEKIGRIIGHILPENRAMLQICRKAGFKVEHDAEGHDYLTAYSVK
jgi:RimJ/RimL family protein N-acetyltransferase